MKIHRDAITGRFVGADHVKANPETTVTETPRGCKCGAYETAALKDRIRALEALVDSMVRAALSSSKGD